ncbi:hypothetical protein LSCM1_01591 [Leishmania martiniquensis]|uniref:Uncharacterized protein n=1 Tax=Leishmania martiniquensis TaxID=1580590 RepID=A0A836GXC9_9TRYP|nr:hypothetical protein LSCM1_01591 [Leishmania martiniquensis]
MSRSVCWHEVPVSLRISAEAAHWTQPLSDHPRCTNSTAERHHCQLASSLPLDARSAQHILVFGARGVYVHAAPLHITFTDVSPNRAGAATISMANLATAPIETTTEQPMREATVPNAVENFAPPPAPSVDTAKAGAVETPAMQVAGNGEEWTDAVDEEAMAFFGDE